MEEKVFVGFNYGRFKDDQGGWQNYCNAFVLEEFNGTENNDYHFGGQKAVKYGCTSPDVLKGIEPGMIVKCFFDSKKKISYMIPADKA